MNLLLDTHILLWAAADSPRLPRRARALILESDHRLIFSVASIWELAIKRGIRREEMDIHPRELRGALLDNGFEEMAISGEHALLVEHLPPIHRDPFDRLLVAQATIEGLTLLTCDDRIARYPAEVLHV